MPNSGVPYKAIICLALTSNFKITKLHLDKQLKKIKSDLLTYDVHALGIVCIATIMHTIFY
jgi:hypothetical protein